MINFDEPLNTDQYIQRVGRVGRFGKSGIAISFVIEEKFVKDLEKYCDIEINELPFDVKIFL